MGSWCAVSTGSTGLNDRVIQLVTRRFGFGLQSIGNQGRVYLLGTAAFITDQEDSRVLMSGVTTSNISVQTLNLVHEAHTLQKLQSAINGRGLCCTFAIELCQEIIRFGRAWAFEE